jgi:hypothetical protein
MASFDRDDLETLTASGESGDDDSFEIEFGQLPDTFRLPSLHFWRGQAFDAAPPSGQRRRRYSRVAALVAVLCLVLINTLNLTGILPAGLPLISSDNHTTAQAAGTSWFELRERPLHLPTLRPGASCPATPVTKMHIQLQTVTGIGDATIFVSSSNMDKDGVLHPQQGDFTHLASVYRGVLATWYIRLSEVEPVLIRGEQLDGPGIVRFDGGIEQPKFTDNLLNGRTLPELLIASNPSHNAPVTSWTTITRIADSGCYAYQIDTPARSMVLVFRAVVAG